MLRVGLTGGLGSGKSTVAHMLGALGAHVVHADTIAREMMEPGQAVFNALIAHFGTEILQPDGHLDRPELARLAFQQGRVEELNSIVHPQVIARQAQLAAELSERDPTAVFVVESALIFETKHAGEHGWQTRFDRILLVTATESQKIARYVARCLAAGSTSQAECEDAAAEARRRLAAQGEDRRKQTAADFILVNEGSLESLEAEVALLWPILAAEARIRQHP